MMCEDSKLDGALTAVLATAERDDRISIFVRTSAPLDERQLQILQDVGVNVALSDTDLFTARLTRDAIDRLGSFPWVRRLTLSRNLQPLARFRR